MWSKAFSVIQFILKLLSLFFKPFIKNKKKLGKKFYCSKHDVRISNICNSIIYVIKVPTDFKFYGCWLGSWRDWYGSICCNIMNYPARHEVGICFMYSSSSQVLWLTVIHVISWGKYWQSFCLQLFKMQNQCSAPIIGCPHLSLGFQITLFSW